MGIRGPTPHLPDISAVERGQWWAELRNRQGLNQEQLARKLGVDVRTIGRWENGDVDPHTRNLTLLASGLKVTVAELRSPPADWRQVAVEPLPSPVEVPEIGDYLDEHDVEQARGVMRRMLVEENRAGAIPVVGAATELLARLRDRLQIGAVAEHARPDLVQTVGELAEITGWFAFDASRHDLARTMNTEARHWLGVAGDTRTDYLTVQNMAMHAAQLGHPGEALLLAQSILVVPTLSARVRALFLIREARALAQSGDRAATRSLAEARRLWAEGTTAADPAWAWWVDERELHWHEAMVLRDLGEQSRAVDHLELALDAVGPNEPRKLFSHRCYLLRGQVEARAWADVETTAETILDGIDDCRSVRTLELLADTVETAPVTALEPIAERLAAVRGRMAS